MSDRLAEIKARLAAAFYGADGEGEAASVLAIHGLDAARDDVRWLVAENERLRADAARLDWLEANTPDVEWRGEFSLYQWAVPHTQPWHLDGEQPVAEFHEQTIRAAIDAAMQTGTPAGAGEGA